jgi:SAM-dependent methyltransferase
LVSPKQRESHVAQSFGFEWKTHHLGGFEKETVFGRGIDEQVKYFFDGLAISDADISGKKILDAGCGSGVLTVEIARRYPAAEVVGIDIIPEIAEVFRKGGQLPNLHVVQANVLEPPFPTDSFDFLWCNGVIHHTGDSRRAFELLTSLIKHGGRAYFWVYEKKPSPMVIVRGFLRLLGLVHWNRRFLYRFCQVLASATWLAVSLLSRLRKLKFVQQHTHLKILTRQRGFRELVLTWFDVLSPMYRDTFTQHEFESWFEECGFCNLSRYWWPVGVSGMRKSSL